MGGYRAEPDGFRELDDERVLVLTQSARGRNETRRNGVLGSPPLGVAPAWPRVATRKAATRPQMHENGGAALFHIRNGTVTRLGLYWDRNRALADLGLKE